MNKEWAEQNEEMQSLIKKAGTFEKGKDVLFGLRNDLMDTLLSFNSRKISTEKILMLCSLRTASLFE